MGTAGVVYAPSAKKIPEYSSVLKKENIGKTVISNIRILPRYRQEEDQQAY